MAPLANMRFNPWALGLAFGLGRIVFSIFSIGADSGLQFLGGFFAGVVFVAVYNAIANRSAARPVAPAI